MVLTRTGKGIDISKMADARMIEELREQIAKLSAAQTAANNENEILKKQIAALKVQNRDLRESSGSGKSHEDHDTQTDTEANPPANNDSSGVPRPINNDANVNLDYLMVF